MARFVQSPGGRGSLKWIQRAVNVGSPGLNAPILGQLPHARWIEWLSPLASDDYAEYRDGAFLERIGRPELRSALADFWPPRGPQWDALGRTDAGDLLLVEAKAHIAEMCSPGTGAGPESRAWIKRQLDELAAELGARSDRVAWTDFFYQICNRLAHLNFLRKQGASAYLVFVNFLNDSDMKGPSTPEAWRAASEIVSHVLGLPKRHSLSRYVIQVYPDVTEISRPDR